MGNYFTNGFAVITLAAVALLTVFIVLSYKNRAKIGKWGGRIALLFFAGIAVSAFSATRDSYGTPGALFAMDGAVSTICSILGGAIALAALVSVFMKKKQDYKMRCFTVMGALFIAMTLVVEIARIPLL